MYEALVALIKPVCPQVGWGWLEVSDSVFPRVTLTDLGEVPAYTLSGEVRAYRGSVQVDVWAEDLTAVLSLARALRALVSGFAGTVSGCVITGIFVRDFQLSSERADDRDHKLGRVRMDLAVRWTA